MSVTVTDTAAREIDTIIRQQDLDPANIRLRVGVKGGGCSGFSYLLDLTEVQKETDESWSVPFNVKSEGDEERSGEIMVVCDPKSYLYLNGTTIDFKDELMGRGFVFNNPNATTTCGCGSSFSA
jgi:iron-sulfur cluster assembly protein